MKKITIALGLSVSTVAFFAQANDVNKAMMDEVVGTSCSVFYSGENYIIDFQSAGHGDYQGTQFTSDFRWKVEDDQFCVSYNYGSYKCTAAPTERPVACQALTDAMARMRIPLVYD